MWNIARIVIIQGYVETVYIAGVKDNLVAICCYSDEHDPYTNIYTREAANLEWENICKTEGAYSIWWENPTWAEHELDSWQDTLESGLEYWDESWKPIGVDDIICF